MPPEAGPPLEPHAAVDKPSLRPSTSRSRSEAQRPTAGAGGTRLLHHPQPPFKGTAHSSPDGPPSPEFVELGYLYETVCRRAESSFAGTAHSSNPFICLFIYRKIFMYGNTPTEAQLSRSHTCLANRSSYIHSFYGRMIN